MSGHRADGLLMVPRRIGKSVNKAGGVWRAGILESVVWHMIREYATGFGTTRSRLMTCAATVLGFATRQAGNWTRFDFCSGMSRFRRLNATSAASSGSERNRSGGLT